MSHSSKLEENLALLGPRDSGLALRLRNTRLARTLSVTVVTSRTGAPVPVVTTTDGSYTLHSRYDPEREAERLVSLQQYNGFVVALGLGAGYHLRVLLQRTELSRLLIVEPSRHLLRALFDQLLFRDILEDPRVRLFCSNSPEELNGWIRTDYTVFIDGSFHVLPLRARTRLDPQRFEQLHQAAEAAAHLQLRDYWTHAAYGRLWMRNALVNLARQPVVQPLPQPAAREALVVAAGPSLERFGRELKRHTAGRVVICCDTALGALRSLSIEPDMVVSIDCQMTTVLHFRRAFGTGHLLAALSTHPSVLRGVASHGTSPAAAYTYFAGGHPFERLAGRSVGLATIDTTGGNVTHSACSVAEHLGARHIYLYGADFSYPFGQPYAKGAYFFDFLEHSQLRLRPYEGGLYYFLRSRGELQRHRRDGYWALQSPLMDRYRTALQGACTIPITRVAPTGERETFNETTATRQQSHASDTTTTGHDLMTPEQFLRLYRERLSGLSLSDDPLWKQLAAHSATEAETVFTLIPYASHLMERLSNSGHTIPMLRSARDRTIDLLETL